MHIKKIQYQLILFTLCKLTNSVLLKTNIQKANYDISPRHPHILYIITILKRTNRGDVPLGKEVYISNLKGLSHQIRLPENETHGYIWRAYNAGFKIEKKYALNL
jgi:hypothetical protein